MEKVLGPNEFGNHKNATSFLGFGLSVHRPSKDEVEPGENAPEIELRNMRLILSGTKQSSSVAADKGTQLDRGGTDRIKIFEPVLNHTGIRGDYSGIDVFAKSPQQKKFPVLEYNLPKISSDHYMIKGEVKVENWPPGLTGHLEMWSHLPASKGGTEIANSFFSRTMAPAGPMKRLESGDEEWRTFVLPARIDDGSGRKPLRLDLNVILDQIRHGEDERPSVQLRNIRFIPDGSEIFGDSLAKPLVQKTPASTTEAAASTKDKSIAEKRSSFSWFAFGLGFLCAAAIGLLWVFFRRRKMESELQRIRDVDSIRS